MDYIKFLQTYINHDIHKLKLSLKKEDFDFDLDDALLQMECRKRTSRKLKNFIDNPYFIFPDKISSEQASHEALAKYHARLCNGYNTVLDLTAGLGIDAMSFSKTSKKVIAIEKDKHKAETLKHNINVAGIKNIEVINDDSIIVLNKIKNKFDLIFIDPSRRDSSLRRLYNLKDCSPNVFDIEEKMQEISTHVLIKASPLLDISQTIRDFPQIKSIKAIGIKGECKEILLELNNSPFEGSIIVEAINLDEDGENINSFKDFYLKPEEKSYYRNNTGKKETPKIDYADISDLKKGAFILEPSAMVMKIAPWEKICSIFNCRKFGRSSHLFITNQYPENFPGRVTILDKIIKKQDRKSFTGLPATAISKNHPLSSTQVREMFKLKEGDKNFIYATKLDEKPILLHSLPV